MAKKTVVNEVVDGLKDMAASIGEATDEALGIAPENKLYERIVPVPPVARYSELPFARVDGSGTASPAKGRPAGPPAK